MSLVQWIKKKIGHRLFFEWQKLKPAYSSRGAALVANSLRRSRSDPVDSGSSKRGMWASGPWLQWTTLGTGVGALADGLGDRTGAAGWILDGAGGIDPVDGGGWRADYESTKVEPGTVLWQIAQRRPRERRRRGRDDRAAAGGGGAADEGRRTAEGGGHDERQHMAVSGGRDGGRQRRAAHGGRQRAGWCSPATVRVEAWMAAA
jgi:hypothetical protein